MPVDQAWVERAESIVGSKAVFTNQADVETYSHDELASAGFTQVPAAVVKPDSVEKVAAFIRLCAETGVPVTVRGGGTGLSAGCVPAEDGVVLSTERLNRVIDADASNHTITVESGMTLENLYRETEKLGLFFPPHPGDESAAVGGVAATNAGGARAVKYGTVRRFIIGLQVVFADGRIAELGGKFVKSSTGYNILGLLIGSEGTLGVITAVTFNLLPAPGCVQTLVVPFARVSDAIEAVPAIARLGIVPFAVEFLEYSTIACSEKLLDKRWPTDKGDASLMVILEGVDEDFVLSQAEEIAEVMEESGALDVLVAEGKQAQAEILEIRSMLYEALRPGSAELLDVCVPRSEIAYHVEYVHGLEEKYGVALPTYGHAADGNIHTQLLKNTLIDGVFGEEIPGWESTNEQIKREIYADAIARGGVISGEHGIGIVKRDFLRQNIGEVNIDVMRAVKDALDPNGILNPGKIFPSP